MGSFKEYVEYIEKEANNKGNTTFSSSVIMSAPPGSPYEYIQGSRVDLMKTEEQIEKQMVELEEAKQDIFEELEHYLNEEGYEDEQVVKVVEVVESLFRVKRLKDTMEEDFGDLVANEVSNTWFERALTKFAAVYGLQVLSVDSNSMRDKKNLARGKTVGHDTHGTVTVKLRRMEIDEDDED